MRRRLLYVLGGLVAVPLVLIVAVWAAAQTGWGRTFIIRQIEAAVNGPDMKLSIGRLEGTIPFDMTLRGVVLADATGPFATIDRARLDWAPLALIDGLLRVEALEADTVKLDRLPVTPPSEAAPSSGPLIPSLPVDVELDRLAVGRIVLGKGVAGVPAELSVEGHARLGDPSEGLALVLDVERLDGPTGKVAADIAFTPDSGRFDVAITLAEPEGGLIATLADLPDRPAVAFSVQGGGTLDDFGATIDGKAGEAADIQGTVRIASADGTRRATADITANVAALVPPKYGSIVAGRTTISAQAAIADDGTVTIDRASVGTAVGTIDAKGTVGADSDLTLAVTAGTSTLLGAVLPQRIRWDAAALEVTLKGDIAAEPAVTIAGTVGNFRFGYPKIEAIIGRDFDLSLGGTVVLDQPTLHLSRIDVTTEVLTASFEGSMDALVPSAEGRLTVTGADLARLKPLTGLELTGGLDLTGDFSMSPDITIGATIDATTTDPAMPGAPVATLLGRSARITGAVGFSDAYDRVTLDDLEIAGERVAIGADGSLVGDEVDMNVRARLPDVAVLVPELAGAVAVDAVATGSLDAPALLARIEAENVEGFGHAAERLAIDVDATIPEQGPSAKVWIDGTVDGTAAKGYAAVGSTPDGALLVDALSLDLPGLRAWGSGGIANGRVGSSTVEFEASDLAPLAAFAGIDLHGRASGRVTLAAAGDRATVAVRLDGVSMPGAAGVTAASITADILDPFGATPRLEAGRISARGLTAGGTTLAETQVDLSGDIAGLDVGLVVRSTTGNVALQGTVARQADGSFQVGVGHLDADRGALRTSLASATTFRVSPDGSARLDGLALRIGGGTVTLTGTVGPQLNVTARVSGLPLSLLDVASPGLGLGGTLEGTATVSGPAASPRAQFDLRAGGVTYAAAQLLGIDRIDVAARGAYAGNTVTLASASVSTANGVRLSLSGTLPLAGGGLDLAVSGGLDLAIANVMLAAGGDTVGGRVALDLRVTGSLANPSPSGTITLSGGRYENPLNGITLTDIAASLRGDGRGLQITSLSAKTPGGGTVTGRGTVGLDTAQGFPLDLTVDARNATLIDSSLATVIADGDLRLVGPWLRQPTLSGTVTIRRAEIRIPETLPASIATIEVRDKAVTPAPPPPGRRAPRPAGGGGPQIGTSTTLALSLDLRVSAPARVYVTGRGIDAEMGGDLRVRGTLDRPDVDGELALRRGSITQLGQRFNFDHGRITFVGGSLDPQLDLLASTTAGDITANIHVAGFASAPEIELSSTPELPQDEVLARLLFGRATGDLSPTQALQLAEAAVELAGGGSATGGILGDVRSSLGLDQLDIQAAQGGNASVTIGRYLTDDIYVGVEQGIGTSSGTKATANFDITPNIKAQVGIGSTGLTGTGTGGGGASSAGGSIGITMEWEY